MSEMFYLHQTFTHFEKWLDAICLKLLIFIKLSQFARVVIEHNTRKMITCFIVFFIYDWKTFTPKTLSQGVSEKCLREFPDKCRREFPERCRKEFPERLMLFFYPIYLHVVYLSNIIQKKRKRKEFFNYIIRSAFVLGRKMTINMRINRAFVKFFKTYRTLY